jgi:hypothetical protein
MATLAQGRNQVVVELEELVKVTVPDVEEEVKLVLDVVKEKLVVRELLAKVS